MKKAQRSTFLHLKLPSVIKAAQDIKQESPMGILAGCSDPPHPQVNKCQRDPVFIRTIVTKGVTV